MLESVRTLSALAAANLNTFVSTQKEFFGSLSEQEIVFPKKSYILNSKNYSKKSLFLLSVSPMYSIQNSFQNLLFRFGFNPRRAKRQKIVVLGTGWASMKFIQKIDVTKYDVVVVSPRNYFSFTPLLPSVCAGVLMPRSCMEPVRNKLCRGGKKVMDFYEAWGTEIDPKTKTLKCKPLNGSEFTLPYDYLVMAVGSEINTFGIPGVEKYAHYLKDVSQAKEIHKKILDCFEQASLPSVTEKEKKKLLHFIMIGGGPSGVETAAEIADLVKHDIKRHFPQLIPYIKVTLIEMLPRVLPAFAPQISEYTLTTMRKAGVDVKLKSRVTSISEDAVHLVDQSGKTEELPYGMVLWASGISQVPLSKHILSSVDAQKSSRVIKVNERLEILGLPQCYGMGDCTWLSPKQLSKNSDELYEMAKSSGTVSAKFIKKHLHKLAKEYPQILAYDLSQLPENPQLTKKEFTDMLSTIDMKYLPPPPTAQAAAQAANYLATMFNRYVNVEDKKKTPAYQYRWRGQMSYVGGGNSVIQTPLGIWLGGFTSHLMWKAFYLIRQMSFTNRFLCVMDWSRTALRGREIGREHSKDICVTTPPTA